jgi:hypothetical protein
MWKISPKKVLFNPCPSSQRSFKIISRLSFFRKVKIDSLLVKKPAGVHFLTFFLCQIFLENQKRSRKARSTPLSKWADSAKSASDQTGVCLAREIHENGEILPELPEEEKIMRKERRRNRGNTRKIDKIKKKINKLDRECALTNSEIDLSELSDEGVMESVRY